MSKACKVYVKVLLSACMKEECKLHVEAEMKQVSTTCVCETKHVNNKAEMKWTCSTCVDEEKNCNRRSREPTSATSTGPVTPSNITVI